MSDDKRIFVVERPELDPAMIAEIGTVRDGPHFELFYDIVFDEMGWVLPDHLRPIVWALADTNINLMLITFGPGSGKSYLMEVAYPLYEMGLNINNTILAVSAGGDLPAFFLQTTMNTVEKNQQFHNLFSSVNPDKELGWSKTQGMFIKRTVTGQPSPTYLALGYTSSILTGQHGRILIGDDLHNEENSQTADARDKIEDFFYRTFIGRGDPQGYRMLIVGRRWAADDLYGRLKKSADFLVMSLSAIRDTKDLYYDVRIPAGLSCVFNNYQASPQVEDIKVKYGENEQELGFFWKGSTAKYQEALLNKKNKPYIFEVEYQSNPESADARIFNPSDFVDFTLPEEMSIGRNYDIIDDYIRQMNFEMIIQSWDTAFTAKTTNDPSVGLTVGIRGCERDHRSHEPQPLPVPFHYDVYVLDEISKHLQMGDLLDEVTAYFNLWQPHYVLIENSASGIPIIQSLQSYSIQIVPVTVQHTSKVSRAIDGAKAGSTQGWAKLGRIKIPRNAQWSQGLLSELGDFTGARGKRDDQVDALVQACNFAIDFGVQTRDLPPGWQTDAEIDEKINMFSPTAHPLDEIPHLYKNIPNPYNGLCAACKNYDSKTSFCKMLKVKMAKIATCPLYEPTKDADELRDY